MKPNGKLALYLLDTTIRVFWQTLKRNFINICTAKFVKLLLNSMMFSINGPMPMSQIRWKNAFVYKGLENASASLQFYMSHDTWFPKMWYFDKCRLR